MKQHKRKSSNWPRNRERRRIKMRPQDMALLQKMYKLYGFECNEQSDQYIVFTLASGYFNNAEIVLLSDHVDREAIRINYESIGYSVRLVEYSSIEETHKNLFVGFFKDTLSNKRTAQNYENFRRKQSERLGGVPYTFVPCKFVSDNVSDDTSIAKYIYNQLFKKGPQLIIVEAAAGYGKTCTSFELIKELISEPRGTIPIMTELSKHRRAQIFKYVLLSEIDSNFRGLSSELVTYEIKNGNVPLIIDGFDELLSKSTAIDGSPVEDGEDVAQRMLSTIAQLFDGDSNAKIVLTSRKSSISAGDIFNELAERYLPNCEVTRIQLIAPSVANWIGYDKAKILSESGINLDNIANPALLAFIAATDEETIRELFISADDILTQYFDIMLTRERDRQSLLLTPDEQLMIMRSVAKYMVELDFSSCTVQDLEFILELAISDTGNIDTYLKRYETDLNTEAYQPSEEEFYVKLSHHALLDRLNNKANSIGFINDFIFGYLLADCFVRHEADNLDLTKIGSKFLDLMITAYGVCDEHKRNTLFEILLHSGINFSNIKLLEIDLHLTHRLTRDYNGVYCSGMVFPRSFDFGNYHIENATFTECVFDHCTIPANVFKHCWFFGCRFYDVQIEGDVDEDRDLIFNNCEGETILKSASVSHDSERPVNYEDLYERKVLEQYWRPGCERADRRRAFETLFRGNDPQDRQEISDAIDRLFAKQVLVQRTNYIELNVEKMTEIKRILEI